MGSLVGLKDGGEAPWLQYEDGRPRVRQMGEVQAKGKGEGVGEGWWSGACLENTEEVGSGEEWARGVPGEGRDSAVCCGRKTE